MGTEWVFVQILNQTWSGSLVGSGLYLLVEKLRKGGDRAGGHSCECPQDMDVDAVVGVNQGFLVEPRQASILNLSFFSTQDEHYCEICVQVWCVTVKQHFQLQLQVILFGQHDKKVEFTHFQTSHFHKGIENSKA